MNVQVPAVKPGAPLQRTEKLLTGRPGAGAPVPQSLSISVSQRTSAGVPESVLLVKYSARSWPAGQAPGPVGSGIQEARASAPPPFS